MEITTAVSGGEDLAARADLRRRPPSPSSPVGARPRLDAHYRYRLGAVIDQIDEPVIADPHAPGAKVDQFLATRRPRLKCQLA